MSPHQFRSIVATALYNDGASLQDLQAVSATMLTSTSTLMRHYVRVNPAEQYAAQANLDSVLGKRSRDSEGEEKEESDQPSELNEINPNPNSAQHVVVPGLSSQQAGVAIVETV